MRKQKGSIQTPFSEILLQPSEFSLQNKKRNIPVAQKTTSAQGKREYMKLYMRLIRNEKRRRR
jgi:hypothetical protein